MKPLDANNYRIPEIVLFFILLTCIVEIQGFYLHRSSSTFVTYEKQSRWKEFYQSKLSIFPSESLSRTDLHLAPSPKEPKLSHAGKNESSETSDPSISSNREGQNERIIQYNSDEIILPYVRSGLAIVGIISSIITMWSEGSIMLTRCGPALLSDSVEKSAYICVFILASGSNLSRIILGTEMANLIPMGECERQLFKLMESMVVLTIVIAFAALGLQVLNGDAFVDGTGLSGIDVRRCRLMNEM